MELSKRWWQLEGDEAAKAVVSIADALASEDKRKDRWQQALALYEAPGIPATAESADFETRYNVSRSAVDTAQAEIASRQRPKPMFLTSGADWKTKRKARKLDRFVEGNLHQRQGSYADVWELAEDMFRVASIAVGSVAKVIADVSAEKIRIEHIQAHEILVDAEEAKGGDPQNWFHVYTMDLDLAVEQFCAEFADPDSDDEEEPEDGEAATKLDERRATNKQKRDRIEEMLRTSAMSEAKSGAGKSPFRLAERVTIREAWRLPLSADKPGKHVFACNGGCLCEEDWTWPYPPFAILVWSREFFGVWGKGLVEEGAEQHCRIQEIADRVHERFKLCAQKVVYFVAGTIDEAAHQSNDSVIFVPVLSMQDVPQERNTPALTAAETQFLAEEIQRYYEMQGVSQMSAASRKDPGVDAAIAMQTLNDIKSVRFMPKARAYELLFVRFGELIVRAARDLATARPNLIAKWPGKRFIESIPWKEVDMAEDQYEVRATPVSAMSRDPAQRLQIAEQLAAAGRIPHEKYLELIGLPDLDSVLQSETAESQWLERLVDRYLDADDDEALEKAGGYEAPDGYFAKPLVALITVQQMYFNAKLEGAPLYNLNLLQRYMKHLEKNISAKAAPAAAPVAMPPEAMGVGMPPQLPAGPMPVPVPQAA